MRIMIKMCMAKKAIQKILILKINKQRPEGQAVISGYWVWKSTVMRKKIVMKFQILINQLKSMGKNRTRQRTFWQKVTTCLFCAVDRFFTDSCLRTRFKTYY